jgi:hypothetical protein
VNYTWYRPAKQIQLQDAHSDTLVNPLLSHSATPQAMSANRLIDRLGNVINP